MMINCNPETVSTDYDTADRLYFEPLTFEDVMAVIEREREGNPDVSCVVQFGGQTPLKLALALQEAGVKILGTSPDSIDLAEDRQRFAQLLWDLGIPQPASGTATSRSEAREVAAAHRLPGRGAPVLRARRPRHGDRLRRAHARSLHGERRGRVARPADPDRPVPRARQGDRRRLRRRRTGAVVIGGIMEHIEEAGIHSGDSSCVVPPPRVSERHLATIRDYTRRIAARAEGHRPDERAVRHQGRHRLRARSESARVAHGAVSVEGERRAAGADRGAGDGGQDAGAARAHRRPEPAGVFVKSPVFPFVRFPGVDTILGPEMKSTGEVMGGASSFGMAFIKAMLGVGQRLPEHGHGLHQRQQRGQGGGAADRAGSGGTRASTIVATRGTAAYLRAHGVDCRRHLQGQRGPPEPGGRDRQPQDRDGHQHAARPRVVLRRQGGAARGDDGAACRASRRSPARPPRSTRSARCRTEGLDVRALQDYYASVGAT